jgi:hypothetical protein
VRQLLIAVTLATAMTFSAGRAHAHDAYSDAESHPLKLLSYPVAAAGFALEWMLTRPVHFMVSQPTLKRVFNYEPAYNAFDTPDPYVPSIYTPQGTSYGRTGYGGPQNLPPNAQVIEPTR